MKVVRGILVVGNDGLDKKRLASVGCTPKDVQTRCELELSVGLLCSAKPDES